ncbi:MAG: flavodoxin-dependent (E)-4-hydroxy-3-methylbut-2-enyl-diphosphate synthase, partial [Caryophanon sp.]|nr:flavodoxin-dependent (E)-4-hydroxy-3-methylbut-2-enyl-diphosphate synthase [Caryophanon sp.]
MNDLCVRSDVLLSQGEPPNYHRRDASAVHIGNIEMGADNPIRVQSMTTANTNDTDACVAQA